MVQYDPNALFGNPVVQRRRGSGASTLLAWLLLVLAVVGAMIWYVTRHRPLMAAHDRLLATFNDRASELTKLKKEVDALKANRADLQISEQNLREELEKTVAEKKAALAELERTQRDLSSSLETEIAAGDVLIEQRGDRLVVDVADKILFPKGEADVSERGQELLKQVARTLSRVKTHVFQVGGHTDSAPVVSAKVREQFPTNWELSTARATNVVRFLESEGGLPGSQLVAAGFASFRPVASNQTARGRQRNRRTEIVLVPKAKR